SADWNPVLLPRHHDARDGVFDHRRRKLARHAIRIRKIIEADEEHVYSWNSSDFLDLLYGDAALDDRDHHDVLVGPLRITSGRRPPQSREAWAYAAPPLGRIFASG